MTLMNRDPQRSFFDVSFLAENLFEETDRYSLFRREVLPALEAQRERLGAMYCANNGRPPIDPVLVAGVTLLQFMEKAPDRQALEHVRFHLGWKHALGLAVDYAGFHATSLVYFRQRLLEHQNRRCVFDAILQGLEGKGWVKRRGGWRLVAGRGVWYDGRRMGEGPGTSVCGGASSGRPGFVGMRGHA